MPTKLLFQIDSYMKEFEGVVTKIDENKVYLDQTAFHPGPFGGLAADTGFIEMRNQKISVLDVKMESNDEVAHLLEKSIDIKLGDKVKGFIDWEKRYTMMKLHTASHILSSVMYNKYNAKITGGHIDHESAKDDFDLSNINDWRSSLLNAIEEANRLISNCVELKIYYLPKEEAMKIPGIVKLAEKFPPNVEKLRIVEIPGIDIQADGGPHVKNTCEIGKIKVINIENRGKNKKRIYYTVTNS
ncbi:MAG: alanyl-tRNA editing protein AlaXM [Caldisphaera sp.]|uniref:alanyl-tRNA editing protein AlaXM n=1 Tax=Caldisphaera sp. TaxID=2060322 RepID=UPI003D0EB597